MSGKKENQLIIIENDRFRPYALDERTVWEVGRLSSSSEPDIQLYSSTVSRKHGKFQNMDGIWFYLDYNGKNGTFYNHRHIKSGIKGRIKPVMLSDGDTLVFGGGEKEAINHKTIWALFLQRSYQGKWRVANTKEIRQMSFISGEKEIRMVEPKKGTVVEQPAGIAIYMGERTYLVGDMRMTGM